jgi:hypothetical protein
MGACVRAGDNRTVLTHHYPQFLIVDEIFYFNLSNYIAKIIIKQLFDLDFFFNLFSKIVMERGVGVNVLILLL